MLGVASAVKTHNLSAPSFIGSKGWGGKKLWVPNIKLPSNTMYYDVIEEDV